jgi:hypothetical protein
MDFAARIHGHKVSMTSPLVKEYARQASIGTRQLLDVLLEVAQKLWTRF